MTRTKKRILKFLAVFITICFVNELVFPTIASALTSGPKSPEFTSFTPVATTNMVDLATGDFNYNLPVLEIPGTDGGGYALSLSYNSGVNSEQEASWVGFGWNLNPGAINRNLRGFPDDYNGETVKLYNKNRPNWSITTGHNIGAEAFTVELGVDKSVRFNNHYGFLSSTDLSVGACGLGLGIHLDPDEPRPIFSAKIDPYKMVSSPKEIAQDKERMKSTKELTGKLEKLKVKYQKPNPQNTSLNLAGGNYGLFTYSDAFRNTSYQKFTGINVNFITGVNINPVIVPIGLSTGGHGNMNLQTGYYETEAKAYGYFNYNVDDNVMLDYYVEKSSDINKRDVFIGMPFSNADIFGVTGEGLSGGFRGYLRKTNNYKYATPGGNSSKITVLNLGIDISAGTNFGAGMSLGAGHQENTMKNWSQITPVSSDPVFRFNNDLGGKITYGEENKVEKADLLIENELPGMKSVTVEDAKLSNTLNEAEAGSASYIEYHTLKQIDNKAENSFTKKINYVNVENSDFLIGGSTIIEYSIYNENGDNYVYGVPVFTRNETNLSFDIDPKREDHITVNNYLAFRNIPLSTSDAQSNKGKFEVKTNALKQKENKAVLGEIRNSPYVSTYLLSQITQPNYIDVNNNGPDDSDFGGWTKFNYRKKYGSFSDNTDENWYRYRSPFVGLHYSQNSISDSKDDLGSLTTGEKEVYYLESIETKTHIAFFVTNKFKDNDSRYDIGDGSAVLDQSRSRKDGIDAKKLTYENDPAANSTSVNNANNNELEYLERIVLFSKAQPDKPIKIIRFDYDYSLVPNIPNNSNSNFDYLDYNKLNKQDIGKLTLKRVWFEYEGTSPARISPYEFSYTYKKSSSVKTGNEYFQEYDNYTSAENPSYAPEHLDPWGNVMPYAKQRQEKDIPWRYQGNHPEFMETLSNSWRNKVEDEEFDPAAWQLKSIKLPSGGEIIIQYEEKDYGYVQDEPVMAMASLINNNNDYNNPWFDINVDDLGCDPGNLNEVNALKSLIDKLFANTSSQIPGSYADKVYFKFLFDLSASNSNSNVNLKNPDAEYVSGYAEYKNSTVEKVEDIEQVEDRYTIRIYLDGRNDRRTPRNAAYEFFVNQRQGILEKGEKAGPMDYNKTFDGTFTDMAKSTVYDDNVMEDIMKIILKMAPLMMSVNDVFKFNTSESKACGSMSNALSYLKLPMLKAKKGGGVRVKRLLMYDSGFETGDARLTGVRYRYVLEDGVSSSGVATNEPTSAREENPLVKYIIRKSQSNFERLTSGTDREQTEGPLGESLLPLPAVYHSRVVVENIHSDKVKTGFTVNEFYTTRDYPFNGNYAKKMFKTDDGGIGTSYPDITGTGVEFTNLSQNSKEDYVPASPTPFFSYSVNKIWMAQGFRFILNSMNGILKKISVYGGSYLPAPGINKKDIDDGYLVSMTQNEYFEPGELIPMIKPRNGGGFEIYKDTPGKEMEIAIEGKQLSDEVFSLDVSFDATVGIAGVVPILFISVVPNIGINQDLVATHATTKVIRYPAILKRVTTLLDGVISHTEYEAFDAYTGQPLIVKKYDGYSDLGLLQQDGTKTGEIYQFSMPANWNYPEMGPKSGSISNSNQLSSQTMNVISYGEPPSNSWFDNSSNPINNILGISVNTYQKNWESSWADPKITSNYVISETVKSKLNSIWRPKAQYIYKTDQTVDPVTRPVYDKGYFSVSNMFNWNTETLQSDWIKVSEITRYSPNGNPLEETDVMNIPSAVIYGSQYGNILPVMIAQNASYDDICFNDFEDVQNNSTMSHSGNFSKLFANQLIIVDNVYVTNHLKQKGGIIKLWMAFEKGQEVPESMNLELGSSSVSLKITVSNGLWHQYESVIPGDLFPVVGSKADLRINGFTGTGNAYIDDVRFQPLDAQATCYVYDLKSFRLMTQFDDQHFGTFYKYNQEGALTHKIIETERGLKTVQETHYNMPKVNR